MFNIDSKQLQILQDIKFLGGWEEDGDLYLWHRVDGARKIIRIPEIQRYFCFRREEFDKISPHDWARYKNNGYYTQGYMKGSYGYIVSDYKYGKSSWNNWLTDLDNNGVTPLEGDVTRIQRFMIDNQLQVAGPTDINGPEVVYFDIETDDTDDIIDVGNQRIISVAWKSKTTGEEGFLKLEALTDEAEREMLLRFYAEMVKYDIRVGYNNYGFDDLVLAGRFEFLHIDTTKWRRISSIDIYNLFERQGTFRNYDVRNHKLDTIARAVLNRGKVDHNEKIIILWRDNPQKLKEYNIEDVRLIYDMEEILGSVGLVLSVSSYAGLLHSLNYSPAKTVDTFLLRSAQKRRMDGGVDFRYPTSYYRPEHMMGSKFSGAFSRNALPSDKRKGRAEWLEEEFGIDYEPVQGALVLEAEPGLYENVHAFDFQSLYPNTIRAFNIGPDTLVPADWYGPKNQAPNGVWYRTDFVSGMSDGVSILIDKRRAVKAGMKLEDDPVRLKGLDILQRGIKELTNSFYGVTAQWGNRHHNKEIAESITSSGRTFLPFGVEFLESRGHKVVIGDTDSLYVAIKDADPEKIMIEYVQALQEMLKFKFNVYKPEYLKMSYEKQMSKVLILAKKLYSAWVTMEDGKRIDGKLVNKGLMMLKGNYPKWASNICMDILTDLLGGKSDDVDHYLRILEREKQKLADGDVDYKQLLISARLGKGLNEYENENALCHVRIARDLAAKGQNITPYMTISYLVIDGKAPISGVDDSEITSETEYDAVYYWNNILVKQVESILGPVFPMIDWDKVKFPRYLKRTNYYQLKVKVKNAK